MLHSRPAVSKNLRIEAGTSSVGIGWLRGGSLSTFSRMPPNEAPPALSSWGGAYVARAGLPISRGGNCFSRRIWHFFATSTVMALAPVTPVIRTVAQIRLIRRLDLKGTATALVSTF